MIAKKCLWGDLHNVFIGWSKILFPWYWSMVYDPFLFQGFLVLLQLQQISQNSKKFRTLLFLELVWLSSWVWFENVSEKTCLCLDWSIAVFHLSKKFQWLIKPSSFSFNYIWSRSGSKGILFWSSVVAGESVFSSSAVAGESAFSSSDPSADFWVYVGRFWSCFLHRCGWKIAFSPDYGLFF